MRRLIISVMPWIGSFFVITLVLAIVSPYMASPAQALSPYYGSSIDTIVAARQAAVAREYTINAEVITIYESTFLVRDGSGEILVDVSPHTTHDLKIAGGMGVQVVGRVRGGVFKPMILSNATGVLASYTSNDNLPPLSEDEVRANTIRHRFISNVMREEIEKKAESKADQTRK